MGRSGGVTIAQVAKAAGVAPSIVSRLLNDDPTLRIRPQTAQRIRSQVTDLDYRPNPAGRSLRTARSNAFGIILPDLASPLSAEILHGAEEATRSAGAAILMGSAEELVEREGPLRNLTGRIDGVLVQRSNVVTDDVLERVVRVGMPVVLINSDLRGPHGSVCLQDGLATAMATQHLIDLGHRDIAHFVGSPSTDTARRRLAGWRDTMRGAGLSHGPRMIFEGGYDPASAHRSMTRLLSRKKVPTGVVVANVIAALSVLAATRELGVRVPEDVSIVTIHDVWFAAHVHPGLTTVRLPRREMAVTAVQLLMDQMAGGEAQCVEVRDPAPELIVRDSSAAPRR